MICACCLCGDLVGVDGALCVLVMCLCENVATVCCRCLVK